MEPPFELETDVERAIAADPEWQCAADFLRFFRADNATAGKSQQSVRWVESLLG